MLKLLVRTLVAVAAPVAVVLPAHAAATYVDEAVGAAVSGYDPVSYFVGDGTPLKGDPKFTVTYEGAVYRFANAANAARFKANPAAYAPQFGGHCAYAASQNVVASGDPLQYKVVGGKLYLNKNARAMSLWVKDIPGNIAAGEKNWPALAKQ